MFRLRLHLRPLTWLALVALLALALLPTVSHALAFARGGSGVWVEVCTPQGLRVVAVDAAERPTPAAPMQAAAHLEHCPFCALQGLDAPLPPAPPAALPLRVTGRSEVPGLFLHAPRTLFAWRTAQPRGPPLFS